MYRRVHNYVNYLHDKLDITSFLSFSEVFEPNFNFNEVLLALDFTESLLELLGVSTGASVLTNGAGDKSD